jgi:hypothetical protein
VSVPEIRYAMSGDVHDAYQVVGRGDVDLVLVSDWATHLEAEWEEPRAVRLFRRLASFGRLIMFDRRIDKRPDQRAHNREPTCPLK